MFAFVFLAGGQDRKRSRGCPEFIWVGHKQMKPYTCYVVLFVGRMQSDDLECVGTETQSSHENRQYAISEHNCSEIAICILGTLISMFRDCPSAISQGVGMKLFLTHVRKIVAESRDEYQSPFNYWLTQLLFTSTQNLSSAVCPLSP